MAVFFALLFNPISGILNVPLFSKFTLYAGWEPLEPRQTTGETVTPYISGYPDGTFRPDSSITRGEAAQLLYNLINSGLLASKEAEPDAHFSDVSSSAWYYGAVTALAGIGAASGYPDGSFGLEDPVTRAQAVTILNNLLNRKTAPALFDHIPMPFKDVPRGHWAYYEIMAAAVAHDMQ